MAPIRNFTRSWMRCSLVRGRVDASARTSATVTNAPGSAGVGPVEFVIDPVGVGERQREALGCYLERTDTALAFGPDESVGQHDVRFVLLAGHGIGEVTTRGTADTFCAHRRVHPVGSDGDRRLHQSGYLEGAAEDLPRHPAELPGVDLGE